MDIDRRYIKSLRYILVEIMISLGTIFRYIIEHGYILIKNTSSLGIGFRYLVRFRDISVEKRVYIGDRP